MNIRPLFRETADNGPTMKALAQLARLAVATEKLKRDTINVDVPKEKLTPERLAKLDQFIADGIQPSLLKIGPISLAPSTEPARAPASPSTIRLMRLAPMRKGPTPCSCRGPRSSRICRRKAPRSSAASVPKATILSDLIGSACGSRKPTTGTVQSCTKPHAQSHAAARRGRAECAAVRLLLVGEPKFPTSSAVAAFGTGGRYVVFEHVGKRQVPQAAHSRR